MKNIIVDWIAGDKNEWFHLLGLNLDSIVPQDAFGVYIIWQYRPFCNDIIFVKVGQGNIVERLSKHRSDAEIAKYAKLPNKLYVTWAEVSKFDVDGVEAYLGDSLKPILGERFPDCEEIEVNLPWDVI
jgi:hypothetical protein